MKRKKGIIESGYGTKRRGENYLSKGVVRDVRKYESGVGDARIFTYNCVKIPAHCYNLQSLNIVRLQQIIV
jgi:hypothetical protein